MTRNPQVHGSSQWTACENPAGRLWQDYCCAPTFMRISIPAVLAAAVFLAGCGGSSSPSAPSGTPTTETFTGTVAIGAGDSHPFTIAQSGGEVDVTLTAAGPPPTIYEGLGIGTYAGTTCTPISSATTLAQAGSTAQLTGVLDAGSYCVEVYDVGNQTAAATYTVTVSHF
ncbi:MAG TPA: hypothetical protein VG871_16735 [Vicinamibacterales bacterium]|nr:hypothetical protein [Vicinamibacterales bacterium]